MYYFDNAATSFPKPESVYDKINKIMRNCGNAGRGDHKFSFEAAREIYNTRSLLAELFNIDDPLNIAFTSNSTESLNLAIKGIFKPKDHIITTMLEHNSVLRPLKFLETKEISHSFLSYDKINSINLKELNKKINKNTKAVIVNHASNVTGEILPIQEIGEFCKKNGILFILDASQSAGLLNIDVKKQNIDILCFTGHKSLYGPQGTGGIFIKPGLDIEPLKQGGTGSDSESLLQPLHMPDYLESGTLNTAGIAGLGSGIEWIRKTGRENILFKERNLREYFIENLKKIRDIKFYNDSKSEKLSVISLNLREVDSQKVAYFLDENFDIVCRGGLHCAPLIHKNLGTINQGTIRFSFSYFNSIKDIDFLVESLIKTSKVL